MRHMWHWLVVSQCKWDTRNIHWVNVNKTHMTQCETQTYVRGCTCLQSQRIWVSQWNRDACDMTSYIWHDSFICVTWLTPRKILHWKVICCYMSKAMTHSHVWHDCDMTHSYVWHDSFVCVTWLICGDLLLYVEGFMSHVWMNHVTHMNESCHTWEQVVSHVWMSRLTHTHQSRSRLWMHPIHTIKCT